MNYLDYKIELIENPIEEKIQELQSLFKNIFSEWDPEWVIKTTKMHSVVCLVLCKNQDGQIIGCKMGYALSIRTFYSWLGGVHHDYRGLGLGKNMAEELFKWCKKKGFKIITTKSMNRFKPMMIFNLKSGFDIVGTELDHQGKVQILFEKKLIE